MCVCSYQQLHAQSFLDLVVPGPSQHALRRAPGSEGVWLRKVQRIRRRRLNSMAEC